MKLVEGGWEWLNCFNHPKKQGLSASESGVAGEVVIEGTVIPRIERFRYLGLIIQENGEIDEDINQRIRVGWQK